LLNGVSGRLTDSCPRVVGMQQARALGNWLGQEPALGIRNSDESSLFTKVFADGLRHLEHIQSGFSKDWFQLFIGYDLTPLLWVLQFVLFDVGPHLFRDLRPGYRSG